MRNWSLQCIECTVLVTRYGPRTSYQVKVKIRRIGDRNEDFSLFQSFFFLNSYLFCLNSYS